MADKSVEALEAKLAKALKLQQLAEQDAEDADQDAKRSVHTQAVKGTCLTMLNHTMPPTKHWSCIREPSKVPLRAFG
eukprot:m.119425 g.119425  ORF g.119425 m.119425 type:complete len:77 (+) comp13676_c1_seq7:2446-2676(+)